ncbi:MAG: FkbM family methyltransferase [Proteobacteria bacterium]|nr:FkbM family methyltransferase [Pseudomonadota bacterium]
MQKQTVQTPDTRQASPQDGDDMRLAHRYFVALARLEQPAWRKLFDPGPLRFAERLLARRAAAPVRRRVPLFFGASMDVLLPEVISEQIHGYGLFDDVVSWMALCAVRPGDTVFDVGAHFGYFSLLFSAAAGSTGRVFSFEPTPSTYTMLAGNVGPDPHITAVNAAAGAAAGRLSIADYGLKFSAWNTLSEAGRLGTSGGAGLLASARPTLLLESGSARAAELAASLARDGYRAFSTERPGELFELTDAAAGALRYKDVLFASGPRAGELLDRAGRLRTAGPRYGTPAAHR